MKGLLFVIFLLPAGVMFTSCKKSAVSTGTLNVTVLSWLDNRPMGNYPGGLTVFLYTSKDNFGIAGSEYESAPVLSQGWASFPGIPARQYWFYVEGPCGSNSGSDSSTTGPIQGGTVNGVTTVYTGRPNCLP